MSNNNNDKMQINILYAVLNWGLGHATRSIPLIRTLTNYQEQNLKCNLTIISTGRALNILKSEFPKLTFIDLPDYNIKYSKQGRNLIFYVALQLPYILYSMFIENKAINKIVKNKNIDMILPDEAVFVNERKVKKTGYQKINNYIKYLVKPCIFKI